MSVTRPVRQPSADKHDERRDQLAESALQTLGELGYARASLREIAANSEFSHGVVHYYFADKLELIVYCVLYYKRRCVTRYDEVIAESAGPDELREAFAARLVQTLLDEAPMHRLWYDLRTQSMFEAGLREAVTHIDEALADMIWRVVLRYAELARTTPSVSPAAAYALLDGLFQQALLAHQIAVVDGLSGDDVIADLVDQVHTVMPLLIRS